MKEPEIHDFADQLVEPDLAPTLAVSDASNDYFNILQDLQKSLADSASETENQSVNPLQFTESDPSLDFAFAEDATAPSAESFSFDFAQFKASTDPNLQLSLDEDFESDFESLVELPPTAGGNEKTRFATDSEFDFAESDNTAFSQQFKEFLEELENKSETAEIENPVVENANEEEFSLPEDLPPFLIQSEDSQNDRITAELPAPDAFEFEKTEENAVSDFAGDAPIISNSAGEFESIENYNLSVAEATEPINFVADVSPFAEEYLPETSAAAAAAAAVEEELPEVPSAFFEYDALFAVAEAPVEEFVADAEVAAIMHDLIALEATTEECVSEIADVEIAAQDSFAEENAQALKQEIEDESKQASAPEMFAAEASEPESSTPTGELENGEVSPENSIWANIEAAENLPEPPAFLFASEENSVDEEIYESDFAPQPEAFREESAQIRNQYIVFSLADNLFAFPAACIDEIGHALPVTAVPFVPDWFSGVASLRGDIIAVLDLRRLWQKPAAPPETRAKMLVVRSVKENLRVGLMVDGVSEMMPLAAEEISPSAEFAESPFAAYLSGISRSNGQPLLMLNPDQFLTAPEIRQL
jgi:purine-binding chemotaxis protein CheW